jgi:hypothetical protein
MNYREYLNKPLTTHFVDYLVADVLANPSKFATLYELIFDNEPVVAWRAAWACQKISEKHAEWFTESQFRSITKLAIDTDQQGLRRGCLATLCNLQLPDPIPVELINSCFEWMVSPHEAIAVQAKSMRMLQMICRVIPEFRSELKICLETIDYESYSAGFQSTRKNVLKELSRTK